MSVVPGFHLNCFYKCKSAIVYYSDVPLKYASLALHSTEFVLHAVVLWLACIEFVYYVWLWTSSDWSTEFVCTCGYVQYTLIGSQDSCAAVW